MLQFVNQAISIRLTTRRAGLSKCSLVVDNKTTTVFSYAEKGTLNPEKPSIVFVHGLSSNKETWIPIIKVSQNDIDDVTDRS